MLGQIRRDVVAFSKSSAYRYGDPGSFSVAICDGIELPGKSDPSDFLVNIGCQGLPKRVLIVCPGNGGLVSACLHAGSDDVVALEPRRWFHSPLESVMDLMARGMEAEGVEGKSARLIKQFPQDEDEQKRLGKFDLIIWPEATDVVSEPKKTYASIAAALNHGGKLIIEMYHGSHGAVDKINMWRPTSEAFFDVLKGCFDFVVTDRLPGRVNPRGCIYTIVKSGKKASSKLAKAEASKVEKIAEVQPVLATTDAVADETPTSVTEAEDQS